MYNHVFIKAGIERAIHTNRIGLQDLPDCSLLSLDLENAFNTNFSAEVFLLNYTNDMPFTPLYHVGRDDLFTGLHRVLFRPD
jgi:hypothetical protein